MSDLAQALEYIVEVTEGNEGRPISKLSSSNNGVNNAIPGVPTGVPHPFSGGSVIWHTKIWKSIFGTSNAHPNPRPLTQAQVNQIVAQAFGNTLAAMATMFDIAASDIQAVEAQLSADVAAIYSDVNLVTQGLAGQINALQHGTVTGLANVENDAVAKAGQYTRDQIAALSRVLGGDLANLTHDLQHEENVRAIGDKDTLAQAEQYALDAAAYLAGLNKAAIGDLAATEHSDVLNLNNRISAVETRVEGDIAAGTNAAENYAAGLVDSLGVPGLRSDLGTLQNTVTKLATETDECLTPLCDTVTPNAKNLGNLGGLLKGLEGLGIAALLSSLVAGAIADPTDAAATIVDVAGWVPGVGTELVQAVT